MRKEIEKIYQEQGPAKGSQQRPTNALNPQLHNKVDHGHAKTTKNSGTHTPASLSNFFRSVDRNYYFNHEMKLKDTVKPNGHYKPNYEFVESRVTTNVKYDAEEHKEELIEKAGVRKRGRDITCCNRVLRVIERQHALFGDPFDQSNIMPERPSIGQGSKQNHALGNH